MVRLNRRIFMLLLFALPLVAQSADAKVSGDFMLSTGAFVEDAGGQSRQTSDFFQQRYSLLWSRPGLLSGGRLGSYDLALGYEWNDLSSDNAGQKTDIGTGKLLYRGSVELNPGALPFYLKFYSQDLQASRVTGASGSGRLFQTDDDTWGYPGRRTLPYSIPDDLYNGTNSRTGLTLMVGPKRSVAGGRWEELVNSSPSLLVDYSETYAKDLKRLQPVHYRDRQLAFVSLNKRDNWLHYRVREFKDYIDSGNSINDQQVQIGTVDFRRQRQWINLTNWVQLSADGQFTKTRRPDLVNSSDDHDIFDLNLMAKGATPKVDVSTFVTFSRDRSVATGLLDQSLEVPVYASGLLDKDRSWRWLYDGSFRRREFTSSPYEKDSNFSKGRIDLFANQAATLTMNLAAEDVIGNQGDAYGGQASLEYRPSRALGRRGKSWLPYLRLGVGKYDGVDRNGATVDQREYQARLVLNRQLSSQWSVRASEEYVHADGPLDQGLFERLAPASTRAQLGATSDASRLGGRYTSLTSELDFGYSKGPVRHAFGGIYQVSEETGFSSLRRWRAFYRLDYSSRKLYARWNNTYEKGSDQGFEVGSVGMAVSSKTGYDALFSSDGNVRYEITRGSQLEFGMIYRQFMLLGGGDTATGEFRQKYLHSLYRRDGPRYYKYLGFEQEIEYEFVANGRDESVATYSLFVNYLPLRIVDLKVGAAYRDVSLSSTYDAYRLMCSLDVKYGKTIVGANLGYGYRDEETFSYSGVQEFRWDLTLRRYF